MQKLIYIDYFTYLISHDHDIFAPIWECVVIILCYLQNAFFVDTDVLYCMVEEVYTWWHFNNKLN